MRSIGSHIVTLALVLQVGGHALGAAPVPPEVVARQDLRAGQPSIGDGPLIEASPTPVPERREGLRSFELVVFLTPLSGQAEIVDPRSGVHSSATMAHVGFGTSLAFELGRSFSLQIGLGFEASAASTALSNISEIIASETLNLDSASATMMKVAPRISVLSDHFGLGLTFDKRWDSVMLTGFETAMETFDGEGQTFGLRALAGFGLRERALRLVADFTYFFRDASGNTASFDATLRADLGVFALQASYERLFAVGAADMPQVQQSLRASLGLQTAF